MSVLKRTIGVIPARLQSTRFPKKVLAPILGKPLVQWVWENASKAKQLDELLIATDSEEVQKVALDFGAQVVLTSETLQSGTDRVAQAVNNKDFEWVINLQGDEPLLPSTAIDELVLKLKNCPQWPMVTLAVCLKDKVVLEDPNVVKVVVTENFEALYFSRQPLLSSTQGDFYKHIGIYGFKKEFLNTFCQWEPSALEKLERLEQLRALEKGVRIGVILVKQDTIAVDQFTDIAKVEQRLMA